MSIKVPLPVVCLLVFSALIIKPVSAQFTGGTSGAIESPQNFDERAIRTLLSYYETSFNDRDIEWRMSLCLPTYREYGFIEGDILWTRDYDETMDEVGDYWSTLTYLDYSLDIQELDIDGPQAFVKAYTTHDSSDDQHVSIVYFMLVRIDGRWRIASDSFNILNEFG